MEKERYTFRLSPETIRQLDELVEKGVIRNRTDGVINAVEQLYEEKRTDVKNSGFLFTLNELVKSPRTIESWENLTVNSRILIRSEGGKEDTVIKKGREVALIYRDFEKEKVVVLIMDRETWSDTRLEYTGGPW